MLLRQVTGRHSDLTPNLLLKARIPSRWNSKAPDASYRDFIMNEVRYSSLARKFPEKAETLFTEAEKQAKEKYEHWTKYSKLFD